MCSMKGFYGLLLIVVLQLGVMAGCGSGGGGSDSNGGSSGGTTSALSGMASKGPISGGTVKVYALNADGSLGNLLGTTITAVDGQYAVYLGYFTGNVLVEVTGGTYKDEATGNITSMNTLALRAALTGVSGSASVAVTPLTEMAVSKAGVLTKTNIDAANSLVGSMIGGVDIIGTMPVDVTAASAANATKAQKEYSLMLATVSQMAKDSGKSISDVIAGLTLDIADGKIDDTSVITSLGAFMISSNNATGLTDPNDTTLAGAILAGGATSPYVGKTDLEKAKALITDLRNTALSIYNYKSTGTSGTFNGIAEELETKIKPELTATVNRIGWILGKASYKSSGNYSDLVTGNQLSISFTAASNDSNDLGYSAASFTVKDAGNNTIDTGTLTVLADTLGRIVTGTFNATMKTASGNLTANLNYTGTVSGGLYTIMTLTGSMTAPGLSLDFSQSGRKLYATFAQQSGSSDPMKIYPTSITFSGVLTTSTAKMSGDLNISSVVWASKGLYSYMSGCIGAARPKTATFTGSFEELSNGSATGVKFNGKIGGSWSNADTYDGCTSWRDTTYTPTYDTAANFHNWSASFNGTVDAPSRPTITASLGVAQIEYNKFNLDALYKRLNTDGTMVFLSGNGTMIYYPNSVAYLPPYMVSTANFTNQDGFKMAISDDESKTGDNKLSGSISTSGGTKMADLYTINSVPMVKYTDNYVESIP